jgi:hypothetical protein
MEASHDSSTCGAGSEVPSAVCNWTVACRSACPIAITVVLPVCASEFQKTTGGGDAMEPRGATAAATALSTTRSR